jgi:RNA polymerase sigma-70 factor, ECF subfamily
MRGLYETYARPLLRLLTYLNGGQQEVAEDMLQETMLRAWRNLDRLEHDPKRLQAWLSTVARRIAIDGARARARRPREVTNYDLTMVPTDGDDAIDAMHNRDVVRAALQRLSPAHRAVLIEIYFRSRSAAEAAAALGIPEGTVKSRTHHAVRALRDAVQDIMRGA